MLGARHLAPPDRVAAPYPPAGEGGGTHDVSIEIRFAGREEVRGVWLLIVGGSWVGVGCWVGGWTGLVGLHGASTCIDTLSDARPFTPTYTYLHTITQRTSIRRKSARPSWEDEEFRFEVADDAQLQNEPVEFKVGWCILCVYVCVNVCVWAR